MKISFSAAILLCVVLIGSCVSPLDPDTPRLRFVDDPVVTPPVRPERIRPRLVTVTVKEMEKVVPFDVTEQLVEIDTSVSPPAVWIRISLRRAEPAPRGVKMVHAFSFRSDSLLTNGVPKTLFGHPREGDGSVFIIGKMVDSVNVSIIDTVHAGPVLTPARIRFEPGRFEPPRKLVELHGFFDAQITQHKLDIEAVINLKF